jgi:hypothetical protein
LLGANEDEGDSVGPSNGGAEGGIVGSLLNILGLHDGNIEIEGVRVVGENVGFCVGGSVVELVGAAVFSSKTVTDFFSVDNDCIDVL